MRAALLRAVSTSDLGDVIRTLVERAKAGDVPSAKLVLERVLGRPNAKLELVDAREPTEVRVLIDGNWYGNEDRLRAGSPAQTGGNGTS